MSFQTIFLIIIRYIVSHERVFKIWSVEIPFIIWNKNNRNSFVIERYSIVLRVIIDELHRQSVYSRSVRPWVYRNKISGNTISSSLKRNENESNNSDSSCSYPILTNTSRPDKNARQVYRDRLGYRTLECDVRKKTYVIHYSESAGSRLRSYTKRNLILFCTLVKAYNVDLIGHYSLMIIGTRSRTASKRSSVFYRTRMSRT